MARKNSDDTSSRNSLNSDDHATNDVPRRGDLAQSERDPDVRIESDSEILEEREQSQFPDNGRGDGSEYYAAAKAGLLDVRRPWGQPDDPARARFPRLMSSLTDRQTPKGKKREVARISLVATKTGFRATLTDYLISMKLTVDFPRLENIMQALEDGIEGRLGWWDEVKSGEGWARRKADETKRLGTDDGL